MHNDQDPILSQLFTAQDQSLQSGDFVLKLDARIDKHQRIRQTLRVFALVSSMLLVAISVPWVAQFTSTLIELAAAGVVTMSPIFHEPLAWLTAGATAAGSSPVIYLWRTGRW